MAGDDDRSATGDERLDQVITDYLEAVAAGKEPSREEWLARYPDLATDLAAFFADHDQMRQVAGPLGGAAEVAPTPPSGPSDADTLPPQPAGAEAATLPPGGTPTAPSPGTKVRYFGDYELVEEIARGGMGVVYRARQMSLNRTVPLKVLWPETSKDEEAVQRFVRAMKTMLPIRHENLVQLYMAGKTGPYCWLAMEFVEGESMAQVIQRIGTVGMLDWQYALRVAVHVARALEAAEKHEIIHRNITPTNILMRTSDKVVKLGDLMLAKAMSGTLARQITRPGELVGDLMYMSPERTRSEAEVDLRSDIYSLGATVYALRTGRPPFEGDSLPEVISKIRQAEPEKPKKCQLSVPDLFEGVVLQMLAKRPEERHQKPAALLKDLERVARYQGITV
jgi:serine/threonine protein kinase